jgi:hypothetical protein
MRDAIGNELRVGDLVVLQLERPVIQCRVVELEDGGLVTGVNHRGGTEIRPGRLILASNHIVQTDPRQPVGAIMALREDGAKAREVSDLAQAAAEEKPN